MSTDMIKIQKGLSIPLAGAPASELDQSVTVRAVALLGDDYPGMKPTMAVQAGDVVKRGDLLFTDKKCEGVRYTSPAGGRVAAVNRGAKRAFESVVVEIEGMRQYLLSVIQRSRRVHSRPLPSRRSCWSRVSGPHSERDLSVGSQIHRLRRRGFLLRRLIPTRMHRIPRSPLRESRMLFC